MYGREEHRYALSRVAVLTQTLDDASTIIESLLRDLRDDDIATTKTACAYLATAQQRVASALGQCDLAVQHLPTPVAREAAS